MSDKPIEIKIDNKEVEKALLELANKGVNMRPLMKNIAGIMASSTAENFKEQGKPKWTDLKESTQKSRAKIRKWPGMILQVEGNLASSISTQYDDESAIIGSNLPYAAIHQIGGQVGKNKVANIPARPYLKLSDDDFKEILDKARKFIKDD